MTEYEQRSRGGRAGYNNSRKRRYRDDDDYDRRPHRRRFEEPLSSRLRRQLLSLAESPLKRVEEEVLSIAKIICDEYDDVSLRTGFYDLVLQLVQEQPFKIPFVAATVQWANALKGDVGGDVLEQTVRKLNGAVEEGEWRVVKLLLRFLGGLQGMLDGDGVFVVLQDLFAKAVELQTGDNEETVGPEIVKIILLTIPYAVASSATDTAQKAVSMIENTDIIASEPHVLQALVDPIPRNDKEEATAPAGALALLQKQLQKESENGWELACLPRPWEVHREADQEDLLALARKHTLPTIVIPEALYVGLTPLFPEPYFSVYTNQDIETVPPTTDIASSLLRDALVDTINVLDYNRNATSRFVIDVDCYFASGTFVKRATPFDRLRDIPAGRSTWKPEDVAVDAVFSQLFQLPIPQHKLVYYHAVLTESCKIAPAAIAPSLGRAIRYLYRNVDTMDLELTYRFTDWFAHHLSNFGFTWKWTEWIDDVELPALNPKKAFIQDALDKEIRLSFAQRIKGTLPAPYQALISEEKEKDSPDFKYNDETMPFASLAQEIHSHLRKKAPASEIAPLLTQITTLARTEHAHPNPLLPAIDAYVTALSFIGSKSLSHMLSCIERNKDQLLAFSAEGSKAKVQIINSIIDYWKFQPGWGMNVLEKLVSYGVLGAGDVVGWCINDIPGRLAEGWCFELVRGTVEKVSGRVRGLLHSVESHLADGENQVHVEQALTTARNTRRELMVQLEDLLGAWAAGSKDQLIQGDMTEEDIESVKRWGERWLRVFQRVGAVEEAWDVGGDMRMIIRRRRKEREEREAKERKEAEAKMREDVVGDAANGNGNIALDGNVNMSGMDSIGFEEAL